MPELPEVQTVVNELHHQITGRRITSVNILRDAIVQTNHFLFEKSISGKTIRAVNRKGKYILFDLGPSCGLLAHLRMTGKFIVQKGPVAFHKHNRVIFYLDRELIMIFNDVRCFGTIELFTSDKTHPKLAKLGWDPWDKQLTASSLAQKLKNRKASIKSVLLDQSVIAGLGNIYVSEILFDACLSPFLEANRLSVSQIDQLITSMRIILTEALKYNGTSISDYRRVDDKQGTFQNFLKVYGKKDEPCSRCATLITKIKQNQRSTYHCSQCQH